ncbi:hypothetical protein FZEAL_6691 [Fusarium zealandicum]|uniref:Uncharacterized protein n=1 Tax=Fusarium zealandicum TaxID=1053134 RepID=A0A8H4XJD1_9HYPO|nr:hypothetical protein FZEAL_6691 [Fusarium zealandicum]
MTSSTSRQALVAAFSFGLVVHAATATVLLVFRGRAASIIRDGPRLAFIIFLMSSILWAQVELVALLLDINSPTNCQITIIFSSLFDQLSRVSMQQSLLWITNRDYKPSPTGALIGQCYVLLRFILGGVFTGIQRPQLDAVCQAHTSILPVGVVVSAIDAVFVAFLLTTVTYRGRAKGAWEVHGTRQDRSLLSITVSLGIWTASSAPLMLGIRSVPVVARTAVPAVGLLIIIVILAFFQSRLLPTSYEPSTPKNGPYDSDTRYEMHNRGISAPYSTHTSQHNNSERAERTEMKRTNSSTMASLEAAQLPVIAMPALGQATVGMGGVPVQGRLVPPPKTQSPPSLTEMKLSGNQLQRALENDSTLVISKPILRHDDNLFAKVATVDLAVAAKHEQRKFKTGKLSIAQGADMKTYQQKSPTKPSDEVRYVTPWETSSAATTTSVLLSPGVEELRRRSPRQPPSLDSPLKSVSSTLQHRVASSPRGHTRVQQMAGAPRNTIVNFSLPADARISVLPRKMSVDQVPKSALSTVPKVLADPGLNRRAVSIVHRPRPIPRIRDIDRAIFPAEGSPNLQHHERSLSCSSIRTKDSPEAYKPLTTGNLSPSMLSEYANAMLGKKTRASAPNATASTRRRSLSVPELPALPLYLSQPKPTSGEMQRINEADRPAQAISITLTSHEAAARSARSPQSLKSSVASPANQETDETVLATCLPWHGQQAAKGLKRRSSPVLPIEELGPFSPDSTIHDDDSHLDWDVRSDATEIHVQRALAVKVMTTAKCHVRREGQVGPLATLNTLSNRFLAMHRPTRCVGPVSDLRRTEELQNTERRDLGPRQVGETRLTFSDRGYSVMQRRSPPPAPLLLRKTDKCGIMQADPSSESENGMEIFHKRHNLNSLCEDVVDLTSLSGSAPADDQRTTLLANLELELSQQEYQWQAIRHTMLGRDSLSTVGTSPSRDSRHGSLHYRQAHLEMYADHDLLPFVSPTSGPNLGKSKLLTSSSFPRSSTSLESPTPREIDDGEYDEESETLVGQTHNVAKAATALWRPITSVAAAATTAPSLWTPASKLSATDLAPEEIPDSTRLVRRRILEPLTIESSRMWEKQVSQHQVSHRGLWRAEPRRTTETQVVEVGTQQPTPRQPPRRIKRATLLPDILENPEPLPNRRGTLGIFQFPWGQVSDCATTARPLTFMAMRGTMASRGSALISGVHGGSDAKDKSSDDGLLSMDDYEMDDEDVYYSSDYETYDSDEDEDEDEDGVVDETTVWEIVKLLEPGRRNVSTETHHEQSGLPSEQKEAQSKSQAAHAQQNSAKLSEHKEDDKTSTFNSNNKTARDFLTTNISSSRTDARPAPGSAGCQTQSPRSPMTPTDMDLREEGLEEKLERVGACQGLSKLDAHLIASSAADAGTPPRPELGAASLSSVPSEPDPSISTAPVPQSLPGAPMNDAVASHETDLPQLLANPTLAPSRPLTWTLTPVDTTPSQLRNQGLAHLVSDRVSAAEAAPANSARHIQIRHADANLDSNSLLFSFPLPPRHSPSHHNPHWNLYNTQLDSMSLWTPSSPVSRPSKGLAQPDDSTWSSYLPTAAIARVVPAKADLATIESNSLWSPPAKKLEELNHGLWGTKTPLPGMWSQPPVLKKVSYGLPQPDAETWATYLIVMDDAARVKPREAEPAFIESNSLWTLPKSVITEEPSEDGLWSGSSAASSVTSDSDSEPSTPAEAVNFGLWAPALAIGADDEPTGLFSLSHRRTEFRTTNLSPAALLMERPRRKAFEAYPDFGFTHLWNMAPLWDAKANAAAVKLQSELDALVLEGLFSLNHRRNNFRTTSELPAALETKPKVRISQDPLPTLSSDTLWSVRAEASIDQSPDWMALSTVGPQTPSVASSEASFYSAPSTVVITRASSIKSDGCSSARRVDATPAQWLAALDEAIRASEPSDKDSTTLDMVAESDPCIPDSSSYQLWSKPDSRDAHAVLADDLWKPTSTTRFLELTPALSDFDKEHVLSGTSRRGRALDTSRPPPPITHGSSSSAFLPAVSSETPRDFTAQALWARTQSPAAGSREDGSWLDKSLKKSLSFVQLW